MAPEVMLNRPYNEKVDIFSLGIIMFEVNTGSQAFTTWEICCCRCCCVQYSSGLGRLCGTRGDSGLLTSARMRVPKCVMPVVAQLFARSVSGVCLLTHGDEAECEMFAWKARRLRGASLPVFCLQTFRSST